jgi:hypothetical protein
MKQDSVQNCSNFANNYYAPDDGEIGWNMLCSRCVKRLKTLNNLDFQKI